jgi:superfamily II DNA/RNA helicase
MTFEDFKLDDGLTEALSYMGFKSPTPIQEKAIPIILANKDIIGCAQTGTGKTGAFLLPILHKLANNDSPDTDTLIIVPTRELALQIEQQIQGFAYFLPIDSIAIYGGGDGGGFTEQKRALSEGCKIVVATPGKLLSHINLGYVNFSKVKHLILDEADRMLDMGFSDDINKIIASLPKQRQNIMFSATMAPKIRKLAQEILNNPEEITLSIAKPAEGVLQGAYLVNDEQKTALTDSLIKGKDNYKSIIIFSSTKKKVSEIVNALKRKGYSVEGISSDFDQTQREEALQRFTSKKTRIVVATDVLSRGIDIKDINLVINYDVPSDAADYVHRVGRTARAETTGVALTFVNERDMFNFKNIEDLIEKEVPKLALPPELGTGPIWNPTPMKKPNNKNKNFKRKPRRN